MDSEEIKKHVKEHYTSWFERGPSRDLPVKTGAALARDLDYPMELLSDIPEETWARFLPCGNPLPHITLNRGDRVLNLGCGAALDSIALLRSAPFPVEIVNLDLVEGVLRLGQILRTLPGLPPHPIHWVCADGEATPFASECFHWIVLNGSFNLFPNKRPLLREIHRLLKPCGGLVVADLCSVDSLPDYFREEPDAWAWCMSGACTEETLGDLLESGGYEQIRRFVCEDGEMFRRVVLSAKKRAARQARRSSEDF